MNRRSITHDQINHLRKLGIKKRFIEAMDPELVPLLIDLNAHGYETWQSCAGHKQEVSGNKKGFVAFVGYPKNKQILTKIINILTSHNLENIRSKRYTPPNGNELLYLTFSAIGNPHGEPSHVALKKQGRKYDTTTM